MRARAPVRSVRIVSPAVTRPAVKRTLGALSAAVVWSYMGALAEPALAASPLHTATIFGASIVAVGSSTSVTVRISDTSESTGVSGVGFVDDLPAGLTVASPSNLDNECGGSATTGPAGVTLTGATLARGAVCAVAFDVKAVAAGVQSNVITAGGSGGACDTGSAQLLVATDAALTGGDPVTEIEGGTVTGFSFDPHPDGIATGPDGHIWFTENAAAGGVARLNADGSVTEFRGGVAPGFTARVQPFGITTGPDGNIWFTEEDRGVARVNGNGTVTEFAAGSTPGFTPSGLAPGDIAAGPDGDVWFNELLDPGIVARVNGDGTVTELTGGVTSGLTANRFPRDVTTGTDGDVWFTEQSAPGAVGRVNADGSVTEFTGGVTPGFTAGQEPYDLTVGSDGHIWFTEAGPYESDGGIGRVNDDGTVTEFAAGTTPGFTAGRNPGAITAGPDGNIWFTEPTGPGAIARLNPDGTVSEFTAGITPGFTTASAVPESITTGPDGDVWFTEDGEPGIVARIAPRSPGVITGTGDATGTSATMHGTVNTDGLELTDCHFEYGVGTGYGTSIPCAETVGSGGDTVAVSATIHGLDPARGYDFRLLATNAAATNVGANQSFATPPIPVIVTGAAGGVGTTTATLVGTVNPEARAITDCHFEYGRTTAYGSTAACDQSPGAGFNPVAVSSEVSGLEPDTTYHFRLVATNAPGTNDGKDQVFMTLADPTDDQKTTTPTPPALSQLVITPRRFRAVSGATIRYIDSEIATTVLTVTHVQAGVRVRGRCVAAKHTPAHARRCSRIIVIGTLTQTDAAGLNTLHLPGRLSGRTLKPGTYTLTAAASEAGVAGNRLSVRFRVLRPRRSRAR